MPKKNNNKTSLKKPNVDSWLGTEDNRVRKALEKASREFDEHDSFSVHTLESIYGQESGFGKNRGKRGSSGAAGDFQMEKKTAIRYGLVVTTKNDERFNIEKAAVATAKYLKDIDKLFSQNSNLGSGLKTVPINNSEERKNFALAAYNAGEGRIAKAQQLAEESGKDPTRWNNVKNYLKDAKASDSKVIEIIDYIEKIAGYEIEFDKKSKTSEKAKDKASTKIHHGSKNGHWITDENGNHIFIEDN